jgi:hypothetical protein
VAAPYHALPPKRPEKKHLIFLFAFELGIVLCSPWQDEQKTMPSSKAKKNISSFFRAFLGEGRDMANWLLRPQSGGWGGGWKDSFRGTWPGRAQPEHFLGLLQQVQQMSGLCGQNRPALWGRASGLM